MTEPPPSKRRKLSPTGCNWALKNSDVTVYHDLTWGVPLYDDTRVFEFLVLEAFQAGLNWLLILRKRRAFADAFHQYEINRVARMGEPDVKRLCANKAIVRNRLKIRAVINNAKIVLQMKRDGLGLADYFWRWVHYKPQIRQAEGRMLAKSELSDRIAADLKKRGFKFLGSIVIYSHLQATGIINDHDPKCPRYNHVQDLVRENPNKSSPHPVNQDITHTSA